MGIVSHVFRLRFLFCPNCVTIDQTHVVSEILTYVYVTTWNKQALSIANIVPMLAGIQHEKALASYNPYSSLKMKTAIKAYGFEYRTLLGQLQHLCQWTILNIQTAVQSLDQYQNAPGFVTL